MQFSKPKIFKSNEYWIGYFYYTEYMSITDRPVVKMIFKVISKDNRYVQFKVVTSNWPERFAPNQVEIFALDSRIGNSGSWEINGEELTELLLTI